MEDNEEQIVADELRALEIEDLRTLPEDLLDHLPGIPLRSHLVRYRKFIEGAAGYTCLIERLLEFAPAGMPALVFWAGFDEAFATPAINRENERARRGVSEQDTALLYSGNVHHSNVEEVRSLYAAIALLQRRGRPVKLLRTGRDDVDLGIGPNTEHEVNLVSLGFVARAEMPGLVAISDVLVQPGRPGPFNDYRFPAKLPEYLVSGRPVVLPDANIGKELTDGVHVLKLGSGDAVDIAEKVERLMDDAALRERLGAAGRSFALEHLTWTGAVDRLEEFYKKLLSGRVGESYDRRSSSQPQRLLYPVKLIAFYRPHADQPAGGGLVRPPANETFHEEVELAREHGIYGFCFHHCWLDGQTTTAQPPDSGLSANNLDFPFCICWSNDPREWQTYSPGFPERYIQEVGPILKDPRYIHVDGAPLLAIDRVDRLPDPIAAIQSFRRSADANGVPRLHLVAIQSAGLANPRDYGLDARIEFPSRDVDRMLVDPARVPGVDAGPKQPFVDYISVAMASINALPVDYVSYRGLFPPVQKSTPADSSGYVSINDSPKAYGQWLRYLVRQSLVRRAQQDPLVFINAWNDRSRGMYLEPAEAYGRGLLEVTRLALHEGIIDFEKGRSAEREVIFTHAVSRLPAGKILGSAIPAPG